LRSSRNKFQAGFLCILMMVLAAACAAPAPHSLEGDYYLLTDMTYLRDAAAYDSNVVGQLYKGDQVERLEEGQGGWWRVRSGRTGQYGWVTAELFSPTPVPVPLLLVNHTVSLRECPRDFCPVLQSLSRGDQVQKVEQNDQGWWRVLVAKSRNLGWLPAKSVAEQLGESQAQEPKPFYFFVTVKGLKLRQQPLVDAAVIKPLQFNDQVEKLDQNPAGWVKVRQPASGAIGWVPGRYLGTTPLKFPRSEKPRKKKPQPPKPVETGPPPEPEIM
jgi:uncharacterized protein YgiM (DUF1202 family)